MPTVGNEIAFRLLESSSGALSCVCVGGGVLRVKIGGINSNVMKVDSPLVSQQQSTELGIHIKALISEYSHQIVLGKSHCLQFIQSCDFRQLSLEAAPSNFASLILYYQQ